MFQGCKTCKTLGSTNCSTSGQDGAGVADADFVVYVAARSFQCGSSMLAYAAHCFQDKTTDRYSVYSSASRNELGNESAHASHTAANSLHPINQELVMASVIL